MSNQKAKKKKKVNETITIAVEVAGKTKTLKVGLKEMQAEPTQASTPLKDLILTVIIN